MATATQLQLSSEPSIKMKAPSKVFQAQVDMDEAIKLANLCRKALADLDLYLPSLNHSHPYTAEEILALPLNKYRVDDKLHDLPRRKSSRHALAEALSPLVYPCHEGSLTAIIRYDADRVRIRAWAVLQRKFDQFDATKRNGHMISGTKYGDYETGSYAPVWTARITGQGPWDPEKKPISLQGVTAIPMPVEISHEDDLAPFLNHLQNGGTHDIDAESKGFELDGGRGEPYYAVKGAEFRKGVVYEDGRMDLCKMVVGPDHIGKLMQSLRPNEFVRHFLLGNNIIGPHGAHEIANFINDLPDRMDTWYLAGNCIDGASFKILVDTLVKSEAVTNVWLKRNPLGADAGEDVYRLITGAKNLRTLDLDQTQLGNRGVAHLFNRLATHTMPEGSRLSLEHIYLNGNGISAEAAQAIGAFLASPHCGLTSLYMSMNPLGNEGAEKLAAALPNAPYLARLFLQSVGVSTQGAIALCNAVASHPSITAFDLCQAYATEDLGQAYNWIDDGAAQAVGNMLKSNAKLAYFTLRHCPMTPSTTAQIGEMLMANKSLLWYAAHSILKDPRVEPTTFVPSKDTHFANPNDRTKKQVQSDEAIRKHLEDNVKARFGENMTYSHFVDEEKRWLVSDKEDVRKIDSVYRNRDAGLARRRLMTLVKNWEDGDDTLERVMKAHGGAPTCSMRRQ